MAGLRFTELQSRSLEFLDFTSVTLDEFQQLVPPFEAVFQARMAADRGACHRTDVPPLPMTAPSVASSAPKTLRHRRSVIVARKRTMLCPAQLPGAPDPVAANGLIGISSNGPRCL